MERLAGVIVTWLIKQKAIEEESCELFKFAAHSFLLGVAPVIYAVIIGGIMGEMSTSIILILPFTVIRKYSGGFHAKREWTCLVSSCLLLYGCVTIALHIQYSVWFSFVIFLAVLSLVTFSPVDSENRRLDSDEKRMRKKETMVISLLFFVLYIGLLLFRLERYAICIGVGIVLTAGLQIPCVVGFLTKKLKKMSFHGKCVEK